MHEFCRRDSTGVDIDIKGYMLHEDRHSPAARPDGSRLYVCYDSE